MVSSSYALSIKWRPQALKEVVGQSVVTQILSYALAQKKLHHAYLLSGTRGVGKTSLARIFAKCLSCTHGVSPEPCGTCPRCQAVCANQFVDLIEIDGASRTKVESIRELLDTMIYAPTQGPYKIYLIDEVHMLSHHSFNALLKTLEEPPKHVKFLLATTEPQKIPRTILSRCLHLQLKPIASAHIADRLKYITQKESFNTEPKALTLLAEAAQGSMRDALSLLEQAIAYGKGHLRADEVRRLLGQPADAVCDALLMALHENKGSALMTWVDNAAKAGFDFDGLFDSLLARLHAIHLHQCVGEGITDTGTLAAALDPNHVRTWYSTALAGKRDASFAPTSRMGFEMTLLRLLPLSPTSSQSQINNHIAVAQPIKKQAPSTQAHSQPKVQSEQKNVTAKQWPDVVRALSLGGLLQNMLEQTQFIRHNAHTIHLAVVPAYHALLSEPASQRRLNQALTHHLCQKTVVHICENKTVKNTPASQKETAQRQHAQATQTMAKEDPQVQSMLKAFDATLLED